jgi:hypothetical protein
MLAQFKQDGIPDTATVNEKKREELLTHWEVLSYDQRLEYGSFDVYVACAVEHEKEWDNLKINKEEKKKIIQDWQALVFDMFKVGTGAYIRFYKFVGCLEIDLELEFMSGHRSCRASLSVGNIMNGTGGLSVQGSSLDKMEHQQKYCEEFDYIKNRFLLPIDKQISVSMIFDAYTKQGKGYYGLNNDDAETPALVAAWAGMDRLAKEAADWAEDYFVHVCEKCNCSVGEHNFKEDQYTTIEEWRRQFDERLANQDALRKQFEDKIVELKLTKVPRYDLILE